MSKKTSYMPDSDSEDELPPGWIELITDDGCVRYVNKATKTIQWTHPRTGRRKRVAGKLPLNWEERYDEKAKCFVFYNRETKQSTLTDPRLAFAIEEPPLNKHQVRQRFDGSSTALQVLHGKDLHGCVALITGGNVGIGYETGRSLALHGCEVYFACRNEVSTLQAINCIIKEKPVAEGRLHFVYLDLASFKSVYKFCEEFKKNIRHIDFLILNASVFGLPYTVTEDHLETTFQVTHLSHFYITLQLQPLYDRRTRIIFVSSESHRFAKLPVDGLTEQDLSLPVMKYWSMKAYNIAKLCNILFALHLAKRWKRHGISVFCLHPGNMVSSQLQRHWWIYRLLFAVVRPFTKSLQQAAATTIYCATADELAGLTGLYFNNCYVCEPSKLSQDDDLQQKLWYISEQLIERLLNKTKTALKETIIKEAAPKVTTVNVNAK